MTEKRRHRFAVSRPSASARPVYWVYDLEVGVPGCYSLDESLGIRTQGPEHGLSPQK